MNLFENLQLIKENSTYESQVDYEVLKQNDIDFFENGSGVYKVITPDGDMLDIDIELSNNPIDRPKYFVSLPSEDVKAVDVDLTTAIIDVINKLNSFPVDKGSKKIKTESSINDKLWYKFNELFKGFIPLKDLTNYFSLDQFGEFVQWARKEADMDYDYDKRYRNWDEVFKDLYDVTGSENTDSISIENIFNFFTTADLEDFWEWIEKEYDLDDEMYESKNVKTEAVSTEDAYRRIEYIRDALDTLESFVNKESSIPDNVGNILKQIYYLVDYIYEYTDTMKEATSSIGGAYTTKAIDMIPTGVKKVNENLYDEYLERVMDEKVT